MKKQNSITKVEDLQSSPDCRQTVVAGSAVRVQRSRQHKNISPNGLQTIYVGRPTKWGNPFKLVGDIIYIDASHRRKILDPFVFLCNGDKEKLLRLYEMVLTGIVKPGNYGFSVNIFDDIHFWVKHFRKLNLSELKGKNLSCWCPLSEHCHADVLLRIVNEVK